MLNSPLNWIITFTDVTTKLGYRMLASFICVYFLKIALFHIRQLHKGGLLIWVKPYASGEQKKQWIPVCWWWCWTENLFFFPKSAVYAFWLSGDFSARGRRGKINISKFKTTSKPIFRDFHTLPTILPVFFAWFSGKIHQKSAMLNFQKWKKVNAWWKYSTKFTLLFISVIIITCI